MANGLKSKDSTSSISTTIEKDVQQKSKYKIIKTAADISYMPLIENRYHNHALESSVQVWSFYLP